jgi:hypothetical protein
MGISEIAPLTGAGSACYIQILCKKCQKTIPQVAQPATYSGELAQAMHHLRQA